MLVRVTFVNTWRFALPYLVSVQFSSHAEGHRMKAVANYSFQDEGTRSRGFLTRSSASSNFSPLRLMLGACGIKKKKELPANVPAPIQANKVAVAPEPKKKIDWCAATWACGAKNTWTMDTSAGKKGAFLNSGTYGQVWAVKGPIAGVALKMPKNPGSQGDCQDLREEAEKMRLIEKAVKQFPSCTASIMTVLDDEPCRVRSDGETIIPVGGSYAMTLMGGDLNDKFPSHCLDGIVDKATTAINCLHNAGWVHSDVKRGNFLWRGLDKNGCPEQIRLADFGLAGKKDTMTTMFSEESFFNNAAVYMSSDTFDISRAKRKENPNLWKLRVSVDHPKWRFKLVPAIDWCSFHFDFNVKYGRYWKGECGPMGDGRKGNLVVL
jgi:hypothetical protein